MTTDPSAPSTAAGPQAGVHRDDWGIPHLWAESADELVRLQGFNAACDRSWQIELERWRMEGRLAEMLGEDHVEWDRFSRQSRLEDTARRCYDNLDDDTRRWCGAYVDGINDALAAGLRGGVEFERSATAPAPWQPWTPLGVFLTAHILFSTFPNKLFRAHVARRLGPAAVDLFSIEAPVYSGSNAWAVHGSGTASGLPLLAGDPHRLLELPGVYQQVRLACPEFDAVGLAFPGVPGLPHFAYTGQAAWAITNAMADYQDLFEEELRIDDQGLWARGIQGWEPAHAREEILLVRGGEPVRLMAFETARGPVVAGGLDAGALSLRFPARVEGRLGFEALLPLLRSRSAAEVEHAMGRWVEPVNSVLAADADGDVRHFLAGLVPKRCPGNRRLPVPASSVHHEWDGTYIDLPSTLVADLAVSANDRAAACAGSDGGTGADAVGLEFAPAHRARRIRELLEEPAAGGHTVADMAAIHSDTLLGPLPVFHALLRELDPEAMDPGAATVRDVILGWNGRMDADSSGAGQFAAWRSALVLRLVRHRALRPLTRKTGFAPLFGPWLDVASRVGFALETLLERGAELGIDVEVEAAAALAEVAETSGNGVLPQPWGGRHMLLPVHLLPGRLADVVPPVQLSGDTGCVLSTESTPGVQDGSFRGPVARYVWDLADRSNSRWIVPFGAAGSPDSPHFSDQLPLWAAGHLVPVVTDWAQLTKETP
ncbi:penicillin acylase family protein [Arthrobacter sp. 35W]|uniref:penicillin acylase family protein n=1 Tax=Arthrobacter sp. 35W TaxID=1132441 RepID=UPI0003FBF46E|nr:penicillin acylase family protein [Arthrobacter sp. 35W]